MQLADVVHQMHRSTRDQLVLQTTGSEAAFFGDASPFLQLAALALNTTAMT